MFTILWKFPVGADRKSKGEELYVAAAISLIPATGNKEDDCNGAEHVAFARKASYGDGTCGWQRTVINAGDVFVMNGEGQTVATYRF